MFQCSIHGWVSVYEACPKCKIPVESVATTNIEFPIPPILNITHADAEVKAKETIHELKTASEYFHEVFMGRKTFEVRNNDRNFRTGDILTLIDGDIVDGVWMSTGQTLSRRVVYILHGGQFGIEKGYCVMSIQ